MQTAEVCKQKGEILFNEDIADVLHREVVTFPDTTTATRTGVRLALFIITYWR